MDASTVFHAVVGLAAFYGVYAAMHSAEDMHNKLKDVDAEHQAQMNALFREVQLTRKAITVSQEAVLAELIEQGRRTIADSQATRQLIGLHASHTDRQIDKLARYEARIPVGDATELPTTADLFDNNVQVGNFGGNE